MISPLNNDTTTQFHNCSHPKYAPECRNCSFALQCFRFEGSLSKLPSEGTYVNWSLGLLPVAKGHRKLHFALFLPSSSLSALSLSPLPRLIFSLCYSLPHSVSSPLLFLPFLLFSLSAATFSFALFFCHLFLFTLFPSLCVSFPLPLSPPSRLPGRGDSSLLPELSMDHLQWAFGTRSRDTYN